MHRNSLEILFSFFAELSVVWIPTKNVVSRQSKTRCNEAPNCGCRPCRRDVTINSNVRTVMVQKGTTASLLLIYSEES